MLRLRSLVAVLVMLLGATASAVAGPQAMHPHESRPVARVSSIETSVSEAVTVLEPFARQRDLKIVVDDFTRARDTGTDALSREQIVNMLANAIAMSPAGGTICVSVRSNTLRVEVLDPANTYEVDREVRDACGNTFHVRSVAGRGTELSASLSPVARRP